MGINKYTPPVCKVVQLESESILCSSVDPAYLQSYKYCSNCRKPIAAVYTYCPHCGRKQ